MTQPRPVTSLAMAAYDTARPPSASTDSEPGRYSWDEWAAAMGSSRSPGGRVGDHLIGAPGVQRLGTDVERCGDGQEGGQQPLAYPNSVIRGFPRWVKTAGLPGRGL
jgi:hypothetical protein